MAPVRPFVPHVRKGGTLAVVVGAGPPILWGAGGPPTWGWGGPDYPMKRQLPAGMREGDSPDSWVVVGD